MSALAIVTALCIILASAQCYLGTDDVEERIEIWNVFANSTVPATISRRKAPVEVVHLASDDVPQRPNDFVIGYNGAGNVLAKRYKKHSYLAEHLL